MQRADVYQVKYVVPNAGFTRKQVYRASSTHVHRFKYVPHCNFYLPKTHGSGCAKRSNMSFPSATTMRKINNPCLQFFPFFPNALETCNDFDGPPARVVAQTT
jgi:hypothetical protein